MLSLPSTSLKIGIQSLVLKTPPMAKSPVVYKRGDWLQGVKQGCLDRTRANEGSRCMDSLIWSLTDNSFYLIAGTSLTRGHQGTSVQANFQEASPLDERSIHPDQSLSIQPSLNRTSRWHQIVVPETMRPWQFIWWVISKSLLREWYKG